MNHIFWLIPGRLCGRPGPVEVPWSLSELRAAGVQSILTLCEKQHVPDLTVEGFAHARVLLPTNVPPEPEDEGACHALLPAAVSFLEDQLASDRCVLVHCAAGRDRTAMAMASYLAASTGIEAAQAIATVRRARPDALTAEGWETLAVHVISSLWQ